jgi:hypothetical protein
MTKRIKKPSGTLPPSLSGGRKYEWGVGGTNPTVGLWGLPPTPPTFRLIPPRVRAYTPARDPFVSNKSGGTGGQ